MNIKQLPHAQSAIVAREVHQDGTPHIHAFVRFSKKVALQGGPGLTLLDGLAGQHGNYMATRQQVAWIKYIKKEDSMAIEWNMPATVRKQARRGLDWNADDSEELAPSKRALKIAEYAESIVKGRDPYDLNDEDAGFMMMNLDRVLRYQQWLKKKSEGEPTVRVKKVTVVGGGGAREAVQKWLDYAFVDGPAVRPPRTPQLYLWGPPGIGKTRLWSKLAFAMENDAMVSKLTRFDIPTNDNHDEYSPKHQFAVLDEFRGQKKIQWLNRFLDGSPMTLNARYNNHIKSRNIPVMLLSNFAPDTVYKNVEPILMQALLDRLEVVYASSDIDIEVEFEPLKTSNTD